MHDARNQGIALKPAIYAPAMQPESRVDGIFHGIAGPPRIIVMQPVRGIPFTWLAWHPGGCRPVPENVTGTRIESLQCVFVFFAPPITVVG
jgi:hypothetical protein